MAAIGRDFVAEQLWFLIAVVTLPILMLAAMLSVPFGPEFVVIVGWFLLTPVFLFWGEEIAEMVYGPEEPQTEPDPVEVLKRRYAAGEIDEDEFERRLEELMDTDAERAVKLPEEETSRTS